MEYEYRYFWETPKPTVLQQMTQAISDTIHPAILEMQRMADPNNRRKMSERLAGYKP